MNAKLIYTLVLVFTFNVGFAQYVLKDQDDVKWYENISQEDIVMATNDNVLLAGEQLYYSLSCFNATTKRYTKNSKVAYVELVGENGLVFRHKLKLDQGKGQGDFFLPSDINSGNYKLIGYTRWMLNATNHYFEKDIAVLNPFKSIQFESAQYNSNQDVQLASNDILALELDNSNFEARQELNIRLKNINGNAKGRYAVSIRKEDNLNSIVSLSKSFNQSKLADIEVSKKAPSESIYLPEFQGEMLTGSVMNSATAEPAVNVEVALSILSDEAFQDIVVTNEQGVYYFQIKEPYSSTRALIQVVAENRSDYKLNVNAHLGIDYSKLRFDELKIDESLKALLEQRSVYNQIESAYGEVKKNELNLPEYSQPFYGNFNSTFNLDDYARFPTVAETLIEVVEHAWHERRNGPTRYVNVRERENDPYYLVDILPMVVVDGAMIQDHESLLYFNADEVSSIQVYRNEFYYNNRVFQGALKVNTSNKSFYAKMQGDFLQFIDLLSPELDISYQQPKYSEEEDLSRVPDYRTQLYWNPNLILENKNEEIQFFASDVKGTYRITIQGFTDYGRPVNLSKTITVN